MSTNSREVVVEADGRVTIQAVAVPPLAPGEARVRMQAVGICGSDVHAAHGRHPFISLPYRPGHEVMGVVEATGDGVAAVVGTRVVLDPVHSCGRCKYCVQGRNNLCDSVTFFGCSTPKGGFADVFTVPAEQLIAVPDEMSDTQAVLIEPLATPVHAVRLVGESLQGKTVVILGAGTIGLLTLSVVRHAGAGRIIVTDVSAQKRGRALSLGADEVYDATDPGLVSSVRDSLGGSADVVFDCVSIQSTVDQAIGLAVKGGTVVTVGVPAGPVSVPLPLVQDLQVRIQGSATFVRPDLIESMTLISRGVVKPEDFVTETFGFEDAAEAFDAAAGGGQVKVVVLAGSTA